jgi:hypothetical protein
MLCAREWGIFCFCAYVCAKKKEERIKERKDRKKERDREREERDRMNEKHTKKETQKSEEREYVCVCERESMCV